MTAALPVVTYVCSGSADVSNLIGHLSSRPTEHVDQWTLETICAYDGGTCVQFLNADSEYLNTLDQCHIDRLIHCRTLILWQENCNSLQLHAKELCSGLWVADPVWISIDDGKGRSWTEN